MTRPACSSRLPRSRWVAVGAVGVLLGAAIHAAPLLSCPVSPCPATRPRTAAAIQEPFQTPTAIHAHQWGAPCRLCAWPPSVPIPSICAGPMVQVAPPPVLAQRLVDGCCQAADSLPGDALARTAWAAATLQLRDERLAAAIAHAPAAVQLPAAVRAAHAVRAPERRDGRISCNKCSACAANP